MAIEDIDTSDSDEDWHYDDENEDWDIDNLIDELELIDEDEDMPEHGFIADIDNIIKDDPLDLLTPQTESTNAMPAKDLNFLTPARNMFWKDADGCYYIRVNVRDDRYSFHKLQTGVRVQVADLAVVNEEDQHHIIDGIGLTPCENEQLALELTLRARPAFIDLELNENHRARVTEHGVEIDGVRMDFALFEQIKEAIDTQINSPTI